MWSFHVCEFWKTTFTVNDKWAEKKSEEFDYVHGQG